MEYTQQVSIDDKQLNLSQMDPSTLQDWGSDVAPGLVKPRHV